MTDTPMPPDEPVATPVRGRRRGVVIGASAAALAVIAGAAVWATTTLSGGGRQPDELVPKSAFAYLKIDLDPAANQKLAAREFFGKFPKLKDKAGDEETVFEDVLSDVIADEDLDYARDVKPWFDKRAAVAAFPGAERGTAVVAVLRSKDDGQAKASLDRAVAEAKAEGDDVAYRLVKGYAVVGDTAAVEEAVRLTEKESLRDNATYRGDVDRLDGDQVATAWADIGESFDAAKGSFAIPIPLPGAFTDQVKGRVVAGLHLTGDYVEIQGRLLGLDQRAKTPGGDHTLLAGLPADTAAALSFNGLGKAIGDSAGNDLESFVGSYLEGSGIAAGDLLALLGDQAVLAADSFASLDKLRAGLVSTVTDATKAAATAEKANAIFGALGLPVVADVEGDTFVLASPPDYAATLTKGGGGLGSAPRFTKAVGDLKGASSAAYVDLKAVAAAFPGFFGPDVRALTSFGAVSGFDGDEGFFRLRVVAE